MRDGFTYLAPVHGVPPRLQLTEPRVGFRERLCGHEYHEADGSEGGSASCHCGTFSIGRCLECRAPVCGTHSALRADRRLCREHLLEDDAAQQRALLAGAAKDIEDQSRGLLGAALEGLRAVPDPVARFLYFVIFHNAAERWMKDWSDPESSRYRTLAREDAGTNAELFRTMFTEGANGLFAGSERTTEVFDASRKDPSEWTFQRPAVSHWLIENVLRGTVSRSIRVCRLGPGLFGGERKVRLGSQRGWPIKHVSSSASFAGDHAQFNPASVKFLLLDGSVVEVLEGKDANLPHNGPRPLSVDDLRDLVRWQDHLGGVPVVRFR